MKREVVISDSEIGDVPQISGDMLVIKENSLARAAMNLTTAEHRLVNVISSLITPKDQGCEICRKQFRIKDYCDFFGLEHKGNHTQLRRTFLSLRRKSFVVMRGNDQHITGWINTATIKTGEGIVEVTIDERILPFLLYIKDNAKLKGIDTQYGYIKHKLSAIKFFSCEHTFNFYSYLKTCLQNKKSITIYLTIQELRKIFIIGDNEYSQFTGFRLRVLLPVVAEINGDLEALKKYRSKKKLKDGTIAPTDIHVEFSEKKHGLKIVGVEFIVSKSSEIQDISIVEDNAADIKKDLQTIGFKENEIDRILTTCTGFERERIVDNARYAKDKYNERKFSQFPINSLIAYAISCIKTGVMGGNKKETKLDVHAEEEFDIHKKFSETELARHLESYARENGKDMDNLRITVESKKMTFEKIRFIRYLLEKSK